MSGGQKGDKDWPRSQLGMVGKVTLPGDITLARFNPWQEVSWPPVASSSVLMLAPISFWLTGLQLADESIVTSSASEALLLFELRVLRMPQRYWSISRPSNNAVLLHEVDGSEKY